MENIESHKENVNKLVYTNERIAHWGKIAVQTDRSNKCSAYYHKRLQEIMRFIVPPGQSVLEIGCSKGDLLASLNPSYGVGVDFSNEMIRRATNRHPDLHFIHADVHDLDLEDKFDFVILSDVVNELWDVQSVFEKILAFTTPQSRIIINLYSRLWELPLEIIRKSGLAKPMLLQNWLTVEDIRGLLYLENFEVIRHWKEII